MVWRRAVLTLPILLLRTAPAMGQIGDGLIVQTDIPQAYDRDRNVAVSPSGGRDYSALGTRIGVLRFYPRIKAGVGATDNTYLDTTDPRSSFFHYVEPSARLATDWSRHSVQLSGNALIRNYAGASRRNEDAWELGARGQLDVRRSLKIEATATASRNFENLFSGEVDSAAAALSRYRNNNASIQATYTSGRFRTFGVIDYTDFTFSPLPLSNGEERDQSSRDRHIVRATGQIEFARTPSVSLFGQISGSRTLYDRDLALGVGNLDSRGVRLLVGTNIDIAGVARGSLGVGYIVRDYDANIYPTAKGLSVDARVELFPSRLFTVTLAAQRAVQDTLAGTRTPSLITRASIRGDYAVRRNLIANASASYFRQTYIGDERTSNGYRLNVGARYLGSRRIGVESLVGRSFRSLGDPVTRRDVRETRVSIGMFYQL